MYGRGDPFLTGARRLRVLVRALPPDAAFSLGPDRWDIDRELAALTVELLSALNVFTQRVYSREGTHVPDPLRIPRPWQLHAPPPRLSSKTEMAAFLKRAGLRINASRPE